MANVLEILPPARSEDAAREKASQDRPQDRVVEPPPPANDAAATAEGHLSSAIDTFCDTTRGVVATFGGLLRIVGFPLVILVIVLMNLSAIGRLLDEIPGVAARLQKIEGAGIKAELANVAAIQTALPPGAIPSGKVAAAIRKLGPDQFERLIRTANGNASCEYPKAGADIRRFVALDYELAEMDLLKIEEAPQLAADLRDSMKAEEKDRRRKIGDPMRCYTVEMTNLGQDVKTGITKIVAKTFDARVDLH